MEFINIKCQYYCTLYCICTFHVSVQLKTNNIKCNRHWHLEKMISQALLAMLACRALATRAWLSRQSARRPGLRLDCKRRTLESSHRCRHYFILTLVDLAFSVDCNNNCTANHYKFCLHIIFNFKNYCNTTI